MPVSYPLEPGHLRARAELDVTMCGSLERLSPETRDIVERNLIEIRRGLDEIHKALRTDPANDSLQSLLLTTYQEELEYMNRIHRLSEAAPRTDI